ncbi:hypothetical protein WICMUC_005679 [Wickerhamomyces mucosus]|uniref:Uncharacterized protein n=1 Tax=Wickerhamomyces mucosus TaxID=1378264 RepID=A0A9P8T5Y1_9ASCO|nr:hypothetical protein WICMUC_005679 [Wickerhamomyces mucosus]
MSTLQPFKTSLDFPNPPSCLAKYSVNCLIISVLLESETSGVDDLFFRLFKIKNEELLELLDLDLIPPTFVLPASPNLPVKVGTPTPAFFTCFLDLFKASNALSAAFLASRSK